MEAQFTRNNLRSAILALKRSENSEQVKNADAFLTLFAESSAAWEITPTLIHDSELHVQFICSQMLATKIRRHWSDLDAQKRKEVLALLPTLLVTTSSSDRAVKLQICAAFAAAAVRAVPELMPNFFSDMFALAQSPPANSNANAVRESVLEVFIAVADEIDTSLVPTAQRQQFRKLISQNLSSFIAFSSQLITVFASSAVSLTRAALKCFTQWIKFEIKIRMLFEANIFAPLLEMVRSSQYCVDTCELLADVFAVDGADLTPPTISEGMHHPEMSLEVFRSVVSLREFFSKVSSGSPLPVLCLGEITRVLCGALINLVAEFGNANTQLLGRGRDRPFVADYLAFALECTACPSTEAVENILEFWYFLSIPLKDVEVFSELFRVLLKQLTLPTDIDADDDDVDAVDSMAEFRTKAQIVLRGVWNVLGTGMLDLLRASSESAGSWASHEAIFHALQFVGGYLARTTNHSQAIQFFLLSALSLSSHPILDATSCKLLAHYSALFISDGQLRSKALSFIISKLESSSENSRISAAKALRSVCSDCKAALTGDLNALLAAYSRATPSLSSRERCAIIMGITHVIYALPPQQIIPALQSLASPIVETLQGLVDSAGRTYPPALVTALVDELQCMQACAKGLEVSGVDVHPVILMLQALWPLLTQVLQLGCELYVHRHDKEGLIVHEIRKLHEEALNTTGAQFQPLLSAVVAQVVEMFDKTLLSPCLQACANILTVFGKSYNPEPLSAFLLAMTNRVFSHISQSSVVGSSELVASLFELLYGVLIDSPHLLVDARELIFHSLSLAVQCLLHCSTDCKALAGFLTELLYPELAPNDSVPPTLLMSHEVLQRVGGDLISSLIVAASTAVNFQLVKKLAPLVFKLRSQYPQLAEPAIRLCLSSNSAFNDLSNEQREILSQLMLIINQEQRILHFLRDLNGVLNKSKPFDILAIYRPK